MRQRFCHKAVSVAEFSGLFYVEDGLKSKKYITLGQAGLNFKWY